MVYDLRVYYTMMNIMRKNQVDIDDDVELKDMCCNLSTTYYSWRVAMLFIVFH